MRTGRPLPFLELDGERADPGVDARRQLGERLLDLSHPDIDFVSLSQGLGVPATRATTADELGDQLARALAEPGPALIEAVVPSIM